MTPPFLPIEPHASHRILRGAHVIAVEESGNPKGIPVVFLHGGPGSGCKPHHRTFFDPATYRIILMDQRGAGQSSPPGCLEANTTIDLIEDLEVIRSRLGLERWVLFGGSWGATLALLYAETYPKAVAGLILRGCFLARQRDMDWFLGADGVRRLLGDVWFETLVDYDRGDTLETLKTLHEALTGKDELERRRVARAWEHWGTAVTLGAVSRPWVADHSVSARVIQQARLELHYAVHHYYIGENEILENIGQLIGIPTMIVHGRQDLVCPLESSLTLHGALPGSSLKIVEEGGHIAAGDQMVSALVEAALAMAHQLEKEFTR